MTLKAAIFDLDGTIITSSGTAVRGIAEAIARLRALGVRIAIASNYGAARARNVIDAAGLKVDLFSGPDTARVKKPSPGICSYVASELRVELNEMIYVGDSDTTDAICAVNAKVLYFNAMWSNPSPKYGLPASSPESLVRFVRRFMLAPPVWYWSLDRKDRLARPVDVRCLLPAGREFHDLKGVLKFGQDPLKGKVGFRGFLFRRLLTSLYMEGIASDVGMWTWYPSHSGESKHRKFHEFLKQASQVFKATYAHDILIRHKPSIKLAFARTNHEEPEFTNQLDTVHVNPEYRSRLRGKQVLVVDDFCTAGNSFECARNLLLTAGAERVICVAFGRYRDIYSVRTPRVDTHWDPFSPQSFLPADFVEAPYSGAKNFTAATEMERMLNVS